jgi:ribosomal protein L14E/L6E/L27E
MSYRNIEAVKVIEENVTMTEFHCDVCGDCLVPPKETYSEALSELLDLKGVQKVKSYTGEWLHSCCHKTHDSFKKYLKEKRIQKQLAEAVTKANEQAARASAQGPGCHCAICSELKCNPPMNVAPMELNLLELLRLLQERG